MDRDWFDDLKAVRDVEAPAELKHLLLVLHTYVRQDSCWPSMGTIARCLGISVSAARRRVDAAEEAGWLSVVGRFDDGRQTSNRYVIKYERMYGEGEGSVDARGGWRGREGEGGVDARGEGGVDATPVTVQKEQPHHQQQGDGGGAGGKELEAWAEEKAKKPSWLPTTLPWIQAHTWLELARECPNLTAEQFQEAMKETRVKTQARQIANPAGFLIARLRSEARRMAAPGTLFV